MKFSPNDNKPLIINPLIIKVITIFIYFLLNYIKYAILSSVVIITFVFIAVTLINYQVTDLGFIDSDWFEPITNFLLLPLNGEYDQHDIMNSFVKVSFCFFIIAIMLKQLIKLLIKKEFKLPFTHKSLIGILIILFLYIVSVISTIQLEIEEKGLFIVILTLLLIVDILAYLLVRFFESFLTFFSNLIQKYPESLPQKIAL